MTKKLSNKKGFTLAELLVVVAIIAVLVAVSIPIFSAQTKKAHLATNQANARAAKAAAVSSVLSDGIDTTKGTIYEYNVTTGTGAFVTKATGTLAMTADDSKDISAWTINTKLGDTVKMGDETFGVWDVVLKNTSTTATASYDGTIDYYEAAAK